MALCSMGGITEHERKTRNSRARICPVLVTLCWSILSSILISIQQRSYVPGRNPKKDQDKRNVRSEQHSFRYS